MASFYLGLAPFEIAVQIKTKWRAAEHEDLTVVYHKKKCPDFISQAISFVANYIRGIE